MSKVKSVLGTQRFLLFVVILNLLFTGFTFIRKSFETQKMVYVDAIKIVSKYEGMDVAKREFAANASSWNMRLDTLRSEVQQALTDYDKTKAQSSVRKKKLMEELIQSKQQQLLAYEQAVKDLYKKNG